MRWYLKALRQYVDFSGRAQRAEYWMFTLVNLIIGIALILIDYGLGISIFYAIYSFAVFLPGLAVSVRRLHDTGRSGWWLLLGFIPIIGTIILIVWLATDGQPEPNRWGVNPKSVAGGAAVAQ